LDNCHFYFLACIFNYPCTFYVRAFTVFGSVNNDDYDDDSVSCVCGQ